jgi:hypothetical protein
LTFLLTSLSFPAYGVYISQMIRYARASSNYSDFLKRHLHLRNMLLDQCYEKIRLIRSLGRNSANLELLIDKTSSIYLYVKLKALASWIFLPLTSFWRNSYSYEYTNKSNYDKRDDFNFKIINFPNMCSNITASPAYGVYISQMIRYARASLTRKTPLTFFLTSLSLYIFTMWKCIA